MRRFLYLIFGWIALGLGALGVFLPLLPTVPFVILAAFCFAKGNPALEAWLLDHRLFGEHIRVWRERRAISAAGKRAAFIAFAISAVVGLLLLEMPLALIPLAAAMCGGYWIYRRPIA